MTSATPMRGSFTSMPNFFEPSTLAGASKRRVGLPMMRCCFGVSERDGLGTDSAAAVLAVSR